MKEAKELMEKDKDEEINSLKTKIDMMGAQFHRILMVRPLRRMRTRVRFVRMAYCQMAGAK